METKDILKKLRKEHGYKLQSIQDNAGIPIRTYQNYESGERSIGAEALVKLADLYGVTTDYLLGRDTISEKPIDTLAKQNQMPSREKAALAKWLELDPDKREMVLQIMREIVAEYENAEADSIQQTVYQTKVASRGGEPPRTVTMTQAEIDEIKNRPDADPDL